VHGPPISGLDLSRFDRSIRPADDLYRFAEGTWLHNTLIPTDVSEVGSFTTLSLQAQTDQRPLIGAIVKTCG
jgi:predicted metalloendopeptidase